MEAAKRLMPLMLPLMAEDKCCDVPPPLTLREKESCGGSVGGEASVGRNAALGEVEAGWKEGEGSGGS